MPDPFEFDQTLVEKRSLDQDQPTNHKVSNTSVILIYEAKVAEFSRIVTVTWNKSLINYSLTINVDNPLNQDRYTCKIDLKTWQFWGKKGLKYFQVDDKRIDVYWDFRRAKFWSNPEPSSDYYVALVHEDEVVLVIGDLKKDAFRRTRRRPSLDDPTLLCKKEIIFGKKIFSSKAMLNIYGKKEYDIVIEISCGIGDEPELWISIDSYEVIHVTNLNWRFRGNEIVKMIDDIVLEIYWDVYDWVFRSSIPPGIGNGLFIFKPREIDQYSSTFDTRQDHKDELSLEDDDKICLGFDSPLDPNSGFFHVIYAWKIE